MENKSLRVFVIQSIFVLVAIVFLIRLFTMQGLANDYKESAKDNVVREKTIYPSRGLILDRNNKLIVNNEAVYDLVVIPRQAKLEDTTKLCQLLGITREDFDKSVKRMRASKGYSSYRPQVLFKQIPADVYARTQEYLYQFPGFYPQVRTVRRYSRRSAAHILGYIGEVNSRQVDTIDYYNMGDYIGISGIEQTYENVLRGQKGSRHVIVDVHNREIGTYKDGENDVEAQAGYNLNLTIDIDLQEYAEQLMGNKKGSVVAIEPTTGEILALVSSPTYDPNWLTGRIRGEGMKMLQADTLKPLFNRALMAYYPPGSTFKPVMALLALQEEVVGPNYYYGCAGGYRLGRLTVGCHAHASCGTVASAVQHSCNAYFCHLFKLFIEQDQYDNVAEGLTEWHNYLNQFSLGQRIPIDLPNVLKGYVPAPDRYNRMYGKNRWRASTIISLGIGQGELGVTPLQLANMTAIIANRGEYYHPHVVRPLPQDTFSLYKQKQQTTIKKKHFEDIVNGMEQVVLAGTARVAQIPDISICGKTGTAENPHGKDHSLFISFAPKDKSKIAIAVMVENGGFGSTYAAPIASLMTEKYLNGSISEKRQHLEKRILEADLLH